MFRSIVGYILQTAYEFRTLIIMGLIAWAITAAIGSWIEDMEQAAQRIHQQQYQQLQQIKKYQNNQLITQIGEVRQ